VGYFPPAEVFDSSYVDGAAIWDVDIFAAVNRCKAQGYAESDIVIDVILTTDKKLVAEDTTQFKSLQMLYRYIQIARYYGAMDGLTRAIFAYPKANFRYVVGPSTKLPHHWKNPLAMNSEDMQEMFNLGKQDALNVIQQGPGVNAESFVFEYASIKDEFEMSFKQFDVKAHLNKYLIESNWENLSFLDSILMVNFWRTSSQTYQTQSI